MGEGAESRTPLSLSGPLKLTKPRPEWDAASMKSSIHAKKH